MLHSVPGFWRALAILLLSGLLVTVTGGGCYVTYDDDDDCDSRYDDDDDDSSCFDDDDDDGLSIQLAGDDGPVDFRLRGAVVEPSTALGAHPTRRIHSIHDLTLSRQLGPGLHGTASLYRFTEQVLAQNEDLLGLPPEAGQLRFFAVQSLGPQVVATWTQEPAPGASRESVGAGVFFQFNALGHLVQIDNLTVVGDLASRGDATEAEDTEAQ